ncbi:VOC family protein [Streptomyces mobaraensis NBRC 13819 = DSM 40847]|uniref:VOC family protein n=1 Tax=Streptomyces mobaraensis TaxID=35621 RepID=A0A5N5WDL3_STRMB|nr:VOC family protein [Streptomyces mobaraensis]KAB7851015.1 VOC family protein [Streptomyces mobaraensis]QTT75569.1 VOC family protein [Streptomyces mobaraensis NBRC 13819 = DSM 40847]
MSASERAGPGTPCWVSLLTGDLGAAQRFYGAVLGWTFRQGSLGEDFCVALSGGRPVAGLGNVARRMGVAVHWSSYFAVDDADTAAARVRERGGTVAVGPLAFGGGRAVLAADPDGAVFGFWEGRVLRDWSIGSGAAPAWLELRTRDCFDAALFYGGVFQWDSQETDVRYEDDVVMIRVAGQTVACLRGGAVEAAPDPKVRPRWHVYFRVDNVEKAVAAAQAAGGSVVAEPGVSRVGPEATLCDPEGGIFTVTEAARGC